MPTSSAAQPSFALHAQYCSASKGETVASRLYQLSFVWFASFDSKKATPLLFVFRPRGRFTEAEDSSITVLAYRR